MLRILKIFMISCLFLSCSATDDGYQNNPNLANLNFRFQLNLNLPEYNNLQFPGNSFATYTYGVKGIVIYNFNNSEYVAWELSDPNHPASDCSAMTVNGIIATCACEGNEYNIVTGEITKGEGQYTLKPYRIRRSGNIIEVSN
ncbi:hypothetical protein [Gramella sp. AN32]|uniref:Rieske (2Fe-2S) protein n=1 Tax=Christiangramia antarctica TaxID=2058158 RepID=A0ABW5X3U3_9FLAO|nr:hypothetical protein [Gramella sp. AN32]MCM4156345.1 hypothetical protein [Gramella sp. AN32]